MSWTRLDDRWTEATEFDDLDHATRWHYLAMIQFCSRTEKFDGVMRLVDAKRCSDHPDPAQALNSLQSAELIQSLSGSVKVLKIEEHIPPPSVRQEAENARIRKQRNRLHKNGDHSMCSEKHCDEKTRRDVTGHVTRDTGTGQDGTGRDREEPEELESVDIETGEITEHRPAESPGFEDIWPDDGPLESEFFNSMRNPYIQSGGA